MMKNNISPAASVFPSLLQVYLRHHCSFAFSLTHTHTPAMLTLKELERLDPCLLHDNIYIRHPVALEQVC